MKNNFNAIPGILFLLFLSTSCTDLDDNEVVDLTQNTIQKGSELYELLETITTQGDNPVENTVCIDFIYPFKVFIYNSNLIVEDEVLLISDVQFSAFLSQLPTNYSISLSYPLQTTYPDGSLFTVNNNAELKIALDSCSREDIISYCSDLFGSPQGTCVWKVPYIPNVNNDFAGAVFTASLTGTITLHHLNTNYDGTWIFLYLNDELHLNISLAGTNPSIVAAWNYNFKVTTFNGELFELQTPTFSRQLLKDCASSAVFTVGQTGPSGGIIAYDKGSYSKGWRYIEVAPSDSIIEEWGCLNSSVQNAQFNQIGTGYQNTVAIVNTHNNLTNYYLNPSVCSNLNNGSLAAKTALNEVIELEKDWCIPSFDELQLLYNNLHLATLGNFAATKYWSSSQLNTSQAKCIDFNSGLIINLDKNSALIKTRLIRFF